MHAVERFIEASELFAIRTKRPHYDVLMWVMLATGAWSVTPSPPTNPESLPPEERDLLGEAAKHPHFTSKQVREWIEHLEDRRMDQEFLVVGLVRFVERRLEDLSEDRTRGTVHGRQMIAVLEELQSDPIKAAESMEQFNRESNSSTHHFSPEDIPRMIESAERWAKPVTLEEMRDNRVALETWRELAVPLLDDLTRGGIPRQ